MEQSVYLELVILRSIKLCKIIEHVGNKREKKMQLLQDKFVFKRMIFYFKLRKKIKYFLQLKKMLITY